MSRALDSAAHSPPQRPATPRRRVLVPLTVAQLMVVLASTIVIVTLPSLQADLGIADADRQWVLTAYALAFGGLLLVGGRVAELLGRRNALVLGVIGFALASVLGGLATTAATLFAARAGQGVFGALLAPAAFALLSALFADVRDRGRAFAVHAALVGIGGVLGLMLGGALTQFLGWRWTFFVNVPLAAVALIAVALTRLPAVSSGAAPRIDLPGAVAWAVGLFALVGGVTRAGSHGWTDAGVLASLLAAAMLLAAFARRQVRTPGGLLPPRVVLDRNRAGAVLVVALAAAALFGVFLMMTFYLQSVKGYQPVLAGLAFLPMSVGVIIGSTQVASWTLARLSPRAVMVPGLLAAAMAMLMFTQLEADSSYMGLLLPAQLALGMGMGTVFMVAVHMATSGVRSGHTGVASALVTSSQQIGGALGVALLGTVAVSSTAGRFGGSDSLLTASPEATVGGFATAAWWGLGAVLLAVAAASALVSNRAPQPYVAGGSAVAATGHGRPVHLGDDDTSSVALAH
ncbi:MFS transporter [Streptomyces spiramenti]|uniref:MFS transporter n=1 Tax=Streptomyces spiramenti TaxID=2720606 RepID=A0ABX1AVR9_9ACTN|nr:MFS transporter [Streptomyces spiramenti]NJP69120.1 MFS transporter [Streptomyces spiramenti]